MEFQEFTERVKTLVRGNGTSGKPQFESIARLMAEAEVGEALLLATMWRMLPREMFAARVALMPLADPEETPVHVLDLPEKLVQLLERNGVFTLGELADALAKGLERVSGIGVLFLEACRECVAQNLPGRAAEISAARPVTKRDIAKSRLIAGRSEASL